MQPENDFKYFFLISSEDLVFQEILKKSKPLVLKTLFYFLIFTSIITTLVL